MDCPNDRYVNDAAICQAVVGMLARIGVKINLLAQPKAQYFAKVLKAGGYQTSFYLLGWTPGTSDAHNVLYDIMGCRDDPKVSARSRPISAATATRRSMNLPTRVLVEPDTAKRDLLIKEAFEIAAKGLRLYPVAPAGSGMGRLEETEFAATCGQSGHLLLGDQTGIGNFTTHGPR